MTITYTGIKDLTTAQQASLKNLAEEYDEKLTYLAPDAQVRVVVKEQRKHKDKAEFSIAVHVTQAKNICAEGHGVDWDLNTATHEAFRAIETQLKKKK